jgi:DNA-binding CsgD family transcriptional regulator
VTIVPSQGLVGRERELGRVRAFLDQIADEPTKLLLEGEAGIGKTTLWRAGLKEAGKRGFQVLEARPAAAERDLSFAGLADLLSSAHDEISGLPAPQRRALRIALVLDEPEGDPPEQRAIATAVTELLRRVSLEQPVVIGLDDVQWLDAPSGAAIEFAFRRLGEARASVLATSRVTPATPISFADGERMSIGTLMLDELDALIQERLDARFLRPALRQLEQASGGNPFYALELAASLLRSPKKLAPGERLPIPKHLRTIVAGRLEELTPRALEASLATATLAQPTVAAVHAAIEDGEAAIAEAVSSAILEREGEALRFTHPLFAASVYDDAPADVRRAMHKRLAQVISEPEERARQLAEGADGPDATIAAFVEAAAASVAARGAPDAAVRLAKRAVALTPPGRREALHKRRLDCARYSFAAGDPSHAEALLEQQLQEARPGREHADVQFQLGRVRADREGSHAAKACYERALEELGEHQELELQAMILVELACIPGVDLGTSERGLALAEWLGKPDLLARALGIHGLKLTLEGRPVPDELWRRALELESATGELRFDGPTSLYCYAAFITGDLKTAAEHGQRITASMRQRGDPKLPNALLDLSEEARVSGDLEAATRYADEAHDLIVQTGRDALMPQCLLWKARAALLRGDLVPARRWTDEALTLVERLPPEDAWRVNAHALGHSVLAQVAQISGADAQAHRSFAVAIESARAGGRPAQHMLSELIASDIESLLALGEFDEASLQLERLLEMQEKLGFTTLDALVARAQGLAAAAAGDSTEALRQLARAVEAFESLPQPWPFQVAKTLLALGAAQRRARQRLAARETLERAFEIFERLGARLWAEKTHSELERIGGRPTRPGALTATESRVAEIVAAGHSNAEVARELFMSPKTVEWNLSKIYRKLRVRSRAELAAKVANRAASHQP